MAAARSSLSTVSLTMSWQTKDNDQGITSQLRKTKPGKGRMADQESLMQRKSGRASGKEPACQTPETQEPTFKLWVGKIPGRGHGNPLQYSCLEKPTDRGAWQAIVHRVAKSQTQLKHLAHTHSLLQRDAGLSAREPYFSFPMPNFLSIINISKGLPYKHLNKTFLKKEHK